MELSLTVPTATSVRAVPAKLLADNRVVINNHLRRSRGGKVSFTHLIGFAVVRALADFPEMNNHFAEIDGKPTVVTPEHVNLGIAIDLVNNAGKPTARVRWSSPASRPPRPWTSPGSGTAYEDIIRRARAGKLTADDFAGTTLSLTNPGTIGTNHSVPRLMAGQGTIVGVGAMEYPAEFSGMSEEQLTERAISKIMTLTSTYDHRIIQGAQSGEFLRRIHQLLLADDFYDEIFAALRIPYEPVRWLVDRDFTHEGQIDKNARVIELINAYRSNGHLMADTDPLEFTVRTHPDLDITRHGLTLWDLDREFPVDGFAGAKLMKLRDILGVLRDAYCRRVGVEYMHITDPEQRQWLQTRIEVKHDAPIRERAAAHPRPAQRRRGVRDVPADQVRRAEAVQPRGRRDGHRPARRRAGRGGRRGPGRGRHRHAAPRPAQRARQHRRQAVREDLQRVRGEHRSRDGSGLGRRQVPPRRRRHLRGAERHRDRRDA